MSDPGTARRLLREAALYRLQNPDWFREVERDRYEVIEQITGIPGYREKRHYERLTQEQRMELKEFRTWFDARFNCAKTFLSLGKAARKAPNDTDYSRFMGEHKVVSVKEAPPSLAMPEIMTHASTLAKHERANWYGVDARLKMFAGHYIEQARRRGIPLYVNEALRSNARQQELWAEGRSKIRTDGSHGRGCAVDIVHARHGWNLEDEEWIWLGSLGRSVADRLRLPIQWGGDWDEDGVPVIKDKNETFWDPAHWQIRGWRDARPVQAMAKLPMTPRRLLIEASKYPSRWSATDLRNGQINTLPEADHDATV